MISVLKFSAQGDSGVKRSVEKGDRTQRVFWCFATLFYKFFKKQMVCTSIRRLGSARKKSITLEKCNAKK